MINVGVAQHHCINGTDIYRERIAIARLVFPRSLDLATVQENPLACHMKHMTGPGNLTSRSVECQVHMEIIRPYPVPWLINQTPGLGESPNSQKHKSGIALS